MREESGRVAQREVARSDRMEVKEVFSHIFFYSHIFLTVKLHATRNKLSGVLKALMPLDWIRCNIRMLYKNSL